MKNWLKLLSIIPAFAAYNNNNYININRTIKVKGSTPHTYLVIEDNTNHTDYQIATNLTYKICKNKISCIRIIKEWPQKRLFKNLKTQGELRYNKQSPKSLKGYLWKNINI